MHKNDEIKKKEIRNTINRKEQVDDSGTE